MKKKFVWKITAVMSVLILMAMTWYGVDFGASPAQAKTSTRGEQPYNSFQYFTSGGSGDQENEKYGWNMTYFQNLNGDDYFDLVIGTPWYDHGVVNDIGAVYIFYGKVDSSFEDLSHSAADVIITGEFDGDHFGWDVADAGDVNNDGINDLIVGAPNAKSAHGRAYIFFGSTSMSGTYNARDIASRILDGENIGIGTSGNYGSSVSGIGDNNEDGYDDVIVGAPGVDQAVITYGYKNKVVYYPNLWDDDLTSSGVITHDNGVNNSAGDLNTWGLQGNNDGWDWIDSFNDPTNLYGQTTPAQHDHATIYAPWEPDEPDADGLTWANRTELEVMIGRNHTEYNPYGGDWNQDPGASAAWGIEFNINQEIYDYINKNSSIEISFDYSALDTNRIFNNSNLSRRYISTLRSRIWNSTDQYYMGDEFINGEQYLFYKRDNWNVPPWGPIYGHFEKDITEYIDKSGSYYWDFGCYFDTGWNFRYDDGMMAFFDNITMKIINERHVILDGVRNSGFGTTIASLGDIDNDGYHDVMIGAPNRDSGYVVLLNGKKQYMKQEPVTHSEVLLTGEYPGDKFGYSISTAGDVDNDGITDVIIGAPGGNYAYLYYGSTLNAGPLVPGLSEMAVDKKTPQIDFNAGLKTTGNTPGLSGADDGWDIWNGVYGYDTSNTAGSSVRYNGADAMNSDQVDADNEVTIAIGGGLGGGMTTGAKPDSGAYGVEFTVTNAMVSAINSGGAAVLSFDWLFENYGLDQDDTVWIKAFLRNDTDDHDFGWDLDQYAGDNNNKDETNEIYWASAPEDAGDVFIQKCSEPFSKPGSYYIDFGAKVRNYWWENSAWEDGLFHFDNIYLRINPVPDMKYIGPSNSDFGSSVGYADKLNMDDYGDIIIGAPNYNSPNGDNSGALFGFISTFGINTERYASSADFIVYGENPGDNFGWSILGSENLNSDIFSEIIASAINFDSSAVNAGKIYLLSITKGPRIWLEYPQGGEILSGEIMINASVMDPDKNIDPALGVFFYYSTDPDLTDWITIGSKTEPTVIEGNYQCLWDTTIVPDGYNYYIKSWVQDIDLNKGENISLPVTIDNPHPPQLIINKPVAGDVVQGQVQIEVKATDSELDIIGGGINTTKGVRFYFSNDQVTWDMIGNVQSGTQDIYALTLETLPYTDGEYWIKANVTDLDGFELEEIINVSIDNPNREPEISLIAPLNVSELSGAVKVMATAFDFDRDINSSGVTFYISSNANPDQWWPIGNDPTPMVNSSGDEIYSIYWDTATVDDYWYRFKAMVNDSKGVTNESMISEFCVHNKDNNIPVIELMTPIDGKEVAVTQIIRARVHDMEGNINSNGVLYYYSSDTEEWQYLGNTSKAKENEYYDFYWMTDTVPDGEYWLSVEVTDTTGLSAEDMNDEPVIVHNSNLNTPVIEILSPTKGQHINGTLNISVYAHDMENNIDKNGVAIYFSSDGEDWNVISNIVKPTKGDRIYELSWDTTAYNDGIYWLRADVKDVDGLASQAKSDHYYIHNKMNNAPEIDLLRPHSGEFNGKIILNASVFDLENNIDKDGVNFYYSTDKILWTLIGKDSIGTQDEIEYIYDYSWDTTAVADNMYWLKAQVRDLTGLVKYDLSDDNILIHNNLDNPPLIEFMSPLKNEPLGAREAIVVKVTDFENNIESVGFYYSTDNVTWELIETIIKPEKDNFYRVIWSTEEMNNGMYYFKVKALDLLGLAGEVIEGPFEVTHGKDVKSESKETSSDYLWWVIIIVIVIIITVILIMLFIRRSKKHEEKLIAEVATELRHSMEIEREGQAQNQTGIFAVPSNADKNASTEQTYIPASEISQQAPNVHATNTDQTKELQSINIPPLAARVGSGAKINALETSNSKSASTMPKLPPPQVAPDRKFFSSVVSNPVQPSAEEVPPDIDLPPETDVYMPPTEPEEMPVSPYANVQTQSLEEELDGNAPIIEIPDEPGTK